MASSEKEMTQTEISFEPRCKVPESGTLQRRLLDAMKRGERLTPLSALESFRCLSLSQRIGELKRMGWPICSEMIQVNSGKRVACYWMP